MNDDPASRASKPRTGRQAAKTGRRAGTGVSKPRAPARPPATNTPSAVVGIGASAGGLDALKDFFKAMPPDSGMAFAVVQHLEPAHESQMADILSRCTAMSVAPAEDGMPVRPNCVYTIPASKYLSIRAGRLRLTEPVERHGMRMAIDFFFRSLAEDQQEKAICVILSGSGSDGTHGLRAVRSAGGMGMAQEPATAQFGIMPQSAIDTGLVDYVLPPDRMPAALVAFVRHPRTDAAGPQETAEAGPTDELESILKLLRCRTNSDYRCYKKGTVVRRIERRMGLVQVACMEDYLKLLGKDPQELAQLGKDMLIGVSSFFRDSEAFDELRTLAINPLVAGKSPDGPIRVWVPGCATGEEAYSVAILLLEALAAADKGNAVQVFASDVDEEALETARAGIYGDAIATDVTPQRLGRFFLRKDDRYQAGKQLREAVVFARQNLIADPPFSKMDLITCRNVLIYLQPEAQRKVISLFSFALNVGGYLFLGKSESITDPRDLFEIVSKPRRIFRLTRPNRHADDLPVFSGAGRAVGVAADRGPLPPSAAQLALLNQQMLIEHFGAAIVLVEPKGRILHFHGQTEKYLGHPKGQATLNVLDMAAGSLAAKLRRAMGQAREANAPVTIHQVPVPRKGSPLVNITVAPVAGRAGDDAILAIILEDAPLAAEPHRASGKTLEDEPAVAHLEAENKALRADLDETNHEHQAASEELKAANEEVMSMNEELQSTNEELETSKEELQSINEELNTVNNQLNEKVAELTDANNDLANLAGATEIATVFLDAKLRIKQFTPRATELLNLISADVGRPLSHITQNFDGRSLSALAAAVMKNLTPVDKEVQIPDGRWFTMRILPYRTLDDHVNGAVVTFTDVSRLKRLDDSLQRAKAYAESIVGTVREPLLVLDSALRVVSANPAFYRMFQATAATTIGQFVYDLGEKQWNTPELRKRLEGVVPTRSESGDFQVEHDFLELGPRIMRLNARPIEPSEDQPALILLAIEDVTGREQARRQTESLAEELENRVRERTADLGRTVDELEAEVRERLKAAGHLTVMNEALARQASQLRALATELTVAEQTERKRVAQILHDGLQQLLVGAKYGIAAIIHRNKGNEALGTDLGELDSLLGESIHLCRSLVVELSPTVLSGVGLVAAVKWLAEEMKRIHGLEVDVNADAEIAADTEGVALALFQTVRELLFNVVKHAGAKSATVRITRPAENHVRIEVADAGAGFDPAAIDQGSGSSTGLGLFGIQERISHLGGRISVESAPGHGTRVTLQAEVRPPAADAEE
jgi:chemotaxis methyl-accepting protein methylase/signal transduction histidine kinase